MRRKLVLAGILSAFLVAPALAQDYGNPVTGDEPTPGTYLNAPPVTERAPVEDERAAVAGACGLRAEINPGSDDLTAAGAAINPDPVPGVYNTTICG